jgi:basic amino acid/polyamine antiporter, APA family
MLGGVVLYFIYGMRNSNLQHGEMQDDAPDESVYPGPVVEDDRPG